MGDTIRKVSVFFQESKLELKKVIWPSRTETKNYTFFVIIFSIGIALFLGFWDALFLKLLKFLVL